MPHYYFDTCDGQTLLPDEIGLVLPDAASARDAARRSLADLAREAVVSGERHILSIKVRDEVGKVLAEARMLVEVKIHPEWAGFRLEAGR
ncbi:DUF6894 family protein [Pseudaminobacter sp. NGMCC 1.201702]|uniref:DUF6894 family protein n=1 Tax=Pseudaminobacter sp. NGMCC 1.201702 TaxID=3391825 RepID=UPI0039EF30E3